jgi:hypothetical protein
MDKKTIVFLLLVLALLPLISSAPPQQVTTIVEKGLQLEVPTDYYLKQNDDHKFHVHVHNASTGLLLIPDDINFCIIHVYYDGAHIIETNMSADSNNLEWDYTVLGGNFSELGAYQVLIYCEATDESGGFFEFSFEVNGIGEDFTLPQAIIYIGFFGVLVFLFLVSIGLIAKIPTEKMNDNGDLIQMSNLKHTRTVLYAFCYVLIMAILFLVSNIGFAFLNEILFSKVAFAIFQIMYRLLTPMLIIMFIKIFYDIFKSKEMNKIIQRGGEDVGSI